MQYYNSGVQYLVVIDSYDAKEDNKEMEGWEWEKEWDLGEVKRQMRDRAESNVTRQTIFLRDRTRL